MIFRICRISLLMVGHMVGYALAGLRGHAAARRYLRRAFIGWAHFVLKTFDVRLQVTGRENLPTGGERPLIILANHQSQLDIPSLIAAVEGFVGFVAKKELGRVPILSYWMRQIGCVFIDRGNKNEAQRKLNETAAQMGETPLVVFPEGTRSKTGDLLPFKPGGARLAVLAKALVLPVRIEGTRNAFEARAGQSSPHEVRLTLYPVLDTADLPEDRSALDAVRVYVEECWRK